MLITFLVVYIFIYVLINVFFAVLLWVKTDALVTHNQSTVSILIAARNEEKNILSCLQSIVNQNYPVEKLQILVGDDSSEDQTEFIVKSFIQDHPHFQYHKINGVICNLYGKQNVLAQLAHHANGNIIVITDADITHHPDWLSHLIAPLQNDNIGIVSGATIVNPMDCWSSLQSIDWLIGMITVKAMDELGLAITSVGNNMAFSRKAYDAVGGYENLPFSITEDYLLFDAIRKKGFGWKWLFDKRVLNLSAPIPDWRTLIHQRSRWFKGGSSGPWYALVLFGYYTLANPILILSLLLFNTTIILELFFCKYISDIILIISGCLLTQKRVILRYMLWYPVYSVLTSLIIGMYLLLPMKVIWKGRKY
jgi:cellulose synthase/poly-beta-1,6-N-acetylglucosamine synthase-like glycosyltransferase